MDLQNAGIEASSSDTITTDSGVGSETEVDTLENWFKRKLYENSIVFAIFLSVCNKIFRDRNVWILSWTH